MRIKYVGNTNSEVLIRDIFTPQYRTWQQHEIKDVPDDLVISVAGPEGPQDGNAVEAILNCGPKFIDADTGKNPLFSCASCGDAAMNDFFVPHPDKPPVEYADADGKRLCVPCFLFANPHHESYHTRGGHSLPRAFVVKLAALRAAPATAAPAPVAPPSPPPIAKPAASSAPAAEEAAHE